MGRLVVWGLFYRLVGGLGIVLRSGDVAEVTEPHQVFMSQATERWKQ
jgi:hypothetical protein